MKMHCTELTTTLLSIIFQLICHLTSSNAEPSRPEKRSLIDDFMTMPTMSFSYTDDSGSNLIRTFLPENNLMDIQNTDNGNFIIHFPDRPQQITEYVYDHGDTDCDNTRFHSYPYYFFPTVPKPNHPNVANQPPVQNTPITPYLETGKKPPVVVVPQPANVQNQLLAESDIRTNSVGSVIPNVQNQADDIKLFAVASASNVQNQPDYTVFPNATNATNFSVDSVSTVTTTMLKPAPELSEISELSSLGSNEKLEHVIPIIPVELPQDNQGHVLDLTPLTSVSEEVPKDENGKKLGSVIPIIPVELPQDNQGHLLDLTPVTSVTVEVPKDENRKKEEGYITIPKYYYKPVPANTIEKISDETSKTTFSVPALSLKSPSEKAQLTSYSLSENASTNINTINQLPFPNFDNLEDLLNLTYSNATTTVYTRMSDTTKDTSKNLAANSLSYHPETYSGRGINEINYLSEPDPQNPPAPINQQPNTLLVEDWLDMSKRMFDKLGPEDKRRVYEANKAVVDGKYKGNDDSSDVQLKLLKDLYLVAERKKPENVFNIINSVDTASEKSPQVHTKETVTTNKEENVTTIITNSQNNLKPVTNLEKFPSADAPMGADQPYAQVTTTVVTENSTNDNPNETVVTKTVNTSTVTYTPNSRALDNKNPIQVLDSILPPLSKIDTPNLDEDNNSTDSQKPITPTDLLKIFDPNFNEKKLLDDSNTPEIKPEDDHPPTATTKHPGVSYPTNNYNNIFPQLSSAARNLWNSAANRIPNVAPMPAPTNFVPRPRPIYSTNTRSRPVSTGNNGILSNFFSNLLEGFVRSAVEEVAKNYAGNAGREFLRRIRG